LIPTTLVVGARAADRELAIANTLANDTISERLKSAVLLEGLPDGKTLLVSDDSLIVVRIAAGCLCCSNNMIMRTYLDRLIRQKPQQLFLSLSTDTHLEQIKQFLTAPTYENVLEIRGVFNLNPTIA
jgi:G3E family GTPase